MDLNNISKLFDSSSIMNELKLMGNLDSIRGRAVGRSTAMALGFISTAMLHPNTNITVFDHHQDKNHEIKMGYLIESIIDKLALKHFTFKRGSIRYDIFQ